MTLVPTLAADAAAACPAEVTPDMLVARAAALRPHLRAEQAATEKRGQCSDETHEMIRAAGLYRTLQPRAYGGYEFSVETFYRVVMELSRGCPSTGWGFCLGASHVLQAAAFFGRETQDEIFEGGHFIAAARDVPGGTIRPVEGGYRVAGTWHYCSGSPFSTHFLAHAVVADADGSPNEAKDQLLVLLPRRDWTLLETWKGVHGLRGTGSHSIRIDDAFVPPHYVADLHLWDAEGSAATPGARLHGNPMYGSRALGFFHGEMAAIVTGIAEAVVDEYREAITGKKAHWPFPETDRDRHHEYQRVLGLGIARAMAARNATLGGARQFERLCRRQAAGGAAFSNWEDLALYSQMGQAAKLAAEGAEHMIRMSGSSNAAIEGKRMERYSRDLNVYRCHSEGAYIDIFAEKLGAAYLDEGGAL
ncbi:acyl-CoA dehydrogenase family protein [Poseidonocella sp. HB161398]|uniref:acyl-CoA dehydrogenase family protein n=1 Tax=Poseidonocella sp. HB161398 TaxID=2320855 RepID=UPI0014867AA5|nr:acyl-CoA dehydrogenase family protein [Poseidonocella sp. HB161398]